MKNILKSLKVTNTTNNLHHIAASVQEFKLISLRDDLISSCLGGDNLTEVYFKTETGNIYKIFQERNELQQPGKWVLVNKNNPKTKYYLLDSEMYYGYIKLFEKFYYGNGGYTTKVTELVCANSGRLQAGIAHLPEAVLIQQFKKG